jgi:hypothetical protein
MGDQQKLEIRTRPERLRSFDVRQCAVGLQVPIELARAGAKNPGRRGEIAHPMQQAEITNDFDLGEP